MTKRRIILAAINAFLLIAFIVCIAVSNRLIAPLHSQQTARVWAGQSGERFAQVSAFIPGTVEFNTEQIFGVRDFIDSALLEASLEAAPEGRLYADAWSAESELIVTDQRGASVTVTAIGVGGDFFLFHPLRLRDGNYITPNDFARDRVILDEELAWRLFGAIHVAGFELLINEIPFVVAGVVARDSDFASSRAYTAGPGLFMSHEAMMEMTAGAAGINNYMIVMPDPITGFAVHTMIEAIGDETVHIIENSTRFSLANSFRAIRDFGERSIQNAPIAYPYWENAARFAEDWLALLLVLALVFIAFPFVCAVFYGVKLIIFGVRQIRKKIRKSIDKRDKRQYDNYVKERDKREYDKYTDKRSDGKSLTASVPAKIPSATFTDENSEYSVTEILYDDHENL